MKQRSGLYPRVRVDAAGAGLVSQAGGVTLVETARVSGLDRGLSAALSPWRKPTATHDPAKVVLDLALTLALGGDCLADVAMLRAAPGVYGPVASDPTVSRTIDVLAGDADRALAAINTARAQARATVWALAGEQAPDTETSAEAPLIVDVDATLVTSHTEKEQARPTFKRGFGFIRCGRSSITGRRAAGSRWRWRCARATPGATPPPTTSACSATHCASCPATAPAPGREGGC